MMRWRLTGVGWRGGLVGMLSACQVLTAPAAVLYNENFSDVSDWVLVYNDQGGVATLTSDGNVGSFHVAAGNNFAAFVPLPGLVTLAPFDPLNAAYRYFLTLEVDHLTDSTSYSVEIDQFDSSQNYLATVFSVFPQGTFVGTSRVALVNLPWNPSAAYILPKVTVYTGLGDQTVAFNSLGLEMDVLPEPSTFILIVVGALLLRRRRGHGPAEAGMVGKDAMP